MFQDYIIAILMNPLPVKIVEEPSDNLNLFLSVAGGIAIPLILFLIPYFKERCRERLRIWQSNYDALFYFTVYLEVIVKQVEKQIADLIQHGASIKAQPFEFHNLTKNISDAQDFNHEKLFNAYLAFFGRTPDQIKQFRKMMSLVAYFKDQERQVYRSQEKYQDELTDRLYKYKEYAEEQTMSHAALILNMIKQQYGVNDPLYVILNSTALNYTSGDETIDRLQNIYIVPLLTQLLKFRNVPVAVEIMDRARKARVQYAQTKFRMEFTADEFKGYSIQLSAQLERFKAEIAHILHLKDLKGKKCQCFMLIEEE